MMRKRCRGPGDLATLQLHLVTVIMLQAVNLGAAHGALTLEPRAWSPGPCIGPNQGTQAQKRCCHHCLLLVMPALHANHAMPVMPAMHADHAMPVMHSTRPLLPDRLHVPVTDFLKPSKRESPCLGLRQPAPWPSPLLRLQLLVSGQRRGSRSCAVLMLAPKGMQLLGSCLNGWSEVWGGRVCGRAGEAGPCWP
mmetsp:Transcript_18820/g.40525  ORF Transcript_18820/g.40525 Transcript_18820/m.40525 type:complete len:194 (-) Transcript_18820:905-1486(-)